MYDIRQLTSADVEDVLDIEAAVFKSENDGKEISRKERNNRWMPWALKLDAEIVYGSFKDGQLACMVCAEDKNPGSTPSYEIAAVITHPDYQRQGHAKATMGTILPAIQEKSPEMRPHLFVDILNQAAQSLYETFGFCADPDRGYSKGGVRFMCMVRTNDTAPQLTGA